MVQTKIQTEASFTCPKYIEFASRFEKCAHILENHSNTQFKAAYNCVSCIYEYILLNMSFNSYEKSIAMRFMEGDEVGDMNHSCKFPPMIVHILHQEVSAKLGLALKEKVGMFNSPFYITADKNQSKFRKKTTSYSRAFSVAG